MSIWVSNNYKHKIIDDGEKRSEALSLRKMIERKFGEAKKWHGMERARFRGQGRVKIQVLMTFMVINIKRIARLMEENGQTSRLELASLTPT
jgi:IS5 family transposase